MTWQRLVGTGFSIPAGKVKQSTGLDFAVVLALVSAIATVVLANQASATLQLAAKAVHLLAVAGCVAILLATIGIRIIWFVGVVACLYAFAHLTTLRLPYIVFLNALFLAAGAVLVAHRYELAARTMVTITLISGGMMLLQLLGVGEWTQALTTHGFIDAGNQVPKTPYPTLFIDEGVQATYLQGRPAGLLHSNQFASFVAVVAVALRLGSGRSSLIVDFPLAFVAAMTLSKVVFLAAALMILMGLCWKELRRPAIRFALYMLVGICLYIVLFPGMFRTMFNFSTFVSSVALRIINLLSEVLGDRAPFVLELLAKFNAMLAGDEKLVARMEATLNQRDAAFSGFAALVSQGPALLAAIAGLLLMICSGFADGKAKALLSAIRGHHVLVLCAVATFSLSANFLPAAVFWLLLGFCIPRLIDPGGVH